MSPRAQRGGTYGTSTPAVTQATASQGHQQLRSATSASLAPRGQLGFGHLTGCWTLAHRRAAWGAAAAARSATSIACATARFPAPLIWNLAIRASAAGAGGRW